MQLQQILSTVLKSIQAQACICLTAQKNNTIIHPHLCFSRCRLCRRSSHARRVPLQQMLQQLCHLRHIHSTQSIIYLLEQVLPIERRWHE